MLLPLSFALTLALPVAGPGAAIVPVEFPINGGPATAYAGVGTVNRISNLSLSAEAQMAFDTDFQAIGFFGAFALSKDGGYGYSSGVASLEAARDIAMAHCTRLNGTCTVIAELLPPGYTPAAPGTITLSQQISGHFLSAAKNPDYQALAVSEDGAFAMYWGMATQAEADAQAIADCEMNRERDVPGLRDMPCVLVTNLP